MTSSDAAAGTSAMKGSILAVSQVSHVLGAT